MINGLDFCLPLKSVNRKEVFAECEIHMLNLPCESHSSNKLNYLKAKLSDLVHSCCGAPIELGDFNMHKECFQAINSLSCNEQILIINPGKGSGLVMLSKSDYIKKMGSIFDDKTKV